MEQIGGGRATSLLSRLRFWAIAAGVNSNCAPLGPRRSIFKTLFHPTFVEFSVELHVGAETDLLCRSRSLVGVGRGLPRSQHERKVVRRVGASFKHTWEKAMPKPTQLKSFSLAPALTASSQLGRMLPRVMALRLCRAVDRRGLSKRRL